MSQNYRKIGHLTDAAAFRAYARELGLDLPCDDSILTAPGSPLAQPGEIGGRRVGNRFCIHPMEGWDGTEDGRPSEYTTRRWMNFGRSGAKLIWGGEAVAVRREGRANPNQLLLTDATKDRLAELREALVKAHREECGTTDDLLVGLQLTHSGRFCRPNRKDRAEPKILYHHPILDRKFGLPPDYPVLTDGEIRSIIADFHRAARLAADVGFDFVDIKHCHGYLGHEFLSAFTREGPYGGSFENRTRFLREVAEGLRAEVPELMIGVRLSAFDFVPFRPDPARSTDHRPGPGIPEDYTDCRPYHYAFGVNPHHPVEVDLTETFRFLELLRELHVPAVNVSGGSPYYNPHIQRPAMFPPSDGYQPPEDPLVGVARQIDVARQVKERFPDPSASPSPRSGLRLTRTGLAVVGTGFTYLQEYLPHVAQALVRQGAVDFVGLGRMVLAYPELPRDVLTRGQLETKRLCRTFSDCTTAPRRGLRSGCYPLDPFYKRSPEREELQRIKQGRR
jgi:2,4-dienoyl-CoA reductase-like NADH-dependent reductase (Old Yellow Enzyme family)